MVFLLPLAQTNRVQFARVTRFLPSTHYPQFRDRIRKLNDCDQATTKSPSELEKLQTNLFVSNRVKHELGEALISWICWRYDTHRPVPASKIHIEHISMTRLVLPGQTGIETLICFQKSAYSASCHQTTPPTQEISGRRHYSRVQISTSTCYLRYGYI